MYKALVCKVTDLIKHPNADKLQIAVVASGYEVIVGLDTNVGDLGVYFDTDGQLSKDFAEANDLLIRKDPLTNKKIGGGFFDDNRRVRAQSFRGVKSNGFFVPTSYFKFIEDRTGNKVELQEGQTFDTLHGILICNKYFTRRTASTNQPKPPKTNRKDYRFYPCFKQHLDYQKLKDSAKEIKIGSLIIITIKEHGTSAVTGYIPISIHSSNPKAVKGGVFSRLWTSWVNSFKKEFKKEFALFDKVSTEYKFMVGTRNVVLTEGQRDGYYGDIFRWVAADKFRDKLHKGETIYYEIVGYTTTGAPLMGVQSLDKLKKEYPGVKNFSNPMTYTYNCQPGEHDISVYRITHTNEDGYSHDLSWEQVKHRCTELGVKPVREVYKYFYDGNIRDLVRICNRFKSEDDLMPSLIDPTHIEEGVVVRVEDGSATPKFYKDKAFLFGVLEGFWKDDPANVDIEEDNVIEEGVKTE